MAGSGHAPLRDDPNVLLRIEDLVVEFPVGKGAVVHAVSGISFDVVDGETLGIVGESGCGKSTVARSIIRLNDIRGGVVDYQGHDLASLEGEELRRLRPDLQMIFQDPISSLNPRRKIRQVISEGLAVWGDAKGTWSQDRIEELMVAVGIDPRFGDRRPHQFSGGQCQRIGIARALALDPKVIICDEPVSALDVSVQAQVLNLLEDMKARYGLTLLFISHDLSVVKNVSDRIIVMYLGKACEIGNADELYAHPRHPYTRALLAAIPEPAPTVDVEEGDIAGELPSPINPPRGCRFNTRCSHATNICFEEEPMMERVGDADHYVACHHPVEVGVSL
ncbi:MAG: ATP-binding cassette domain-containing protein [Actinobacteria bacterium]|nr:ATP-binding cassette domain-containing protein [Actinomycetota bacterium]NIS31631.1 ATP-binding cassette domain-containing protein [Actinomycetota bacterium]NIT95792.1 ATP-binding cassette domain-containing protein [Actinomycetota bacterium]NIU19472.1 ATP-binding cassette domain-containing protein [Actinomycetota bacterium]NIU66747.1 ATP-binding cassette domain-containing protein [Actinomycetota bacterium]